ncbi:MAG: DNA methyltransferase, partial [Candidatus Angelobacter sp.]
MDMRLAYQTELGRLYESDCLEFLKAIPSGSVHTFFADPPFNLRKKYGKKGSDSLPDEQYLEWSRSWLHEAARTISPGGALFVYNLPKWLIHYGSFL